MPSPSQNSAQSDPNLEPVDFTPQFSDDHLEPVDHQPEWADQMTHNAPPRAMPHPGLMLASRMMDFGGDVSQHLMDAYNWWTGTTTSEKLAAHGIQVPDAIARADKTMHDFMQRPEVNDALMVQAMRGRKIGIPDIPPEVADNPEAAQLFKIIRDRMLSTRQAMNDAIQRGDMAGFDKTNGYMRLLLGRLGEWQKKYNVDYIKYLNSAKSRGSNVAPDPFGTAERKAVGRYSDVWDSQEKLEKLKFMVESGAFKQSDIAKHFGTTEDAVRNKISRENVAFPARNLEGSEYNETEGFKPGDYRPPQPNANKPNPNKPSGASTRDWGGGILADKGMEEELKKLRKMGLSDYDIGQRYGVGPKQVKMKFNRMAAAEKLKAAKKSSGIEE